jgi:MurNAc alpha-1-phosphate uridylyltransferase
MVLAAGLGLRMRPLTLTRPKPLIPVAGRSMLDRALDHLVRAGVERAVVNAHWLADQVGERVARRSADFPGGLTAVTETDLLETGGGIANALALLGDAPFYAVNGDIVWTDGAVPALARLAAAWDEATMDALLLLQPTGNAVGYEGRGDFFRDPDGPLRRRSGIESAPLVFAGVQILHPRLFADAPSGAFSLNLLYDRALGRNRLAGIVHDGGWYHVGTPDALPEVEALLAPDGESPPHRP